MAHEVPLFTYAVIADTHMNQSEDYSSSPYPCNALANARTRRVIAELNELAPDFVVHLGDIVNPVPELPTYGEAAGHFKRLVEDLKAPLYLVPGNHDVGDKPVAWMPAGTVNADHIALYESHFGRHYFSFDHEGLHFVIVNTPLINSGIPAESEQRAWLENDLAENADKRIVLCVHYPPYLCHPDENGNYDNIDEPGRSWLLELIDRFSPEAVFCGHVHNFWYDRRGETEIYLLPSTAFVRHDFSEFFRIGPGDQFGRNDEAKLGYFIVRVFEDRQVVENVRTYGRTLQDGARLPAAPAHVRAVQSRESDIVSFGVDMRQAWAEEMEITPSGAVDEFERKIARNDYPVLALWEIGIRRMRVPAQDLLTPRTRERMRILNRVGHMFQVHVFGLPATDLVAALVEHGDLVDTLEIVLPWDTAPGVVAEIADLKTRIDTRIYLSRVNRKDASKFEGARFNHLISHGFTLAEVGELTAFVDEYDRGGVFDGFMIRVARDEAPLDAARAAARFATETGRKVCLYVKTVTSSPAEAFQDDRDNAPRIAESVLAGACVSAGISVITDTFADIDRGYFARNGLVDRRYNPRPTGSIVATLIALLQGADWSLGEAGERAVVDERGRQLRLAGDDTSGRDESDRPPCITVHLETGVVSRQSGDVTTSPPFPVAMLNWNPVPTQDDWSGEETPAAARETA